MKYFAYLLLVWIVPISVLGQEKYYFNADWIEVDQSEAIYYSQIISLSSDKVLVKDYRIDNTIMTESSYKIIREGVDWSRLYLVGFQDYAVENGKCIQYYQNGLKKKMFHCENGVQKGLIKEWTEEGELLREYSAINNLANGEYSEYFDNGKLNFNVEFRNDTLDGRAAYYYPNGQISQKGNFKEGYKYGKWEYWSEKGEVLANEIYRQMFFIEGPEVKLLFPKGYWCLSDQYKENNRVHFLFSRSGTDLGIATGFVPTCLLSLETVERNSELVDYSSYRRRRLSVDVHKVITKDQNLFSLPNTMGYLASYVDEEKNKHAAIVLHSIQNGVGMELIFDARHEDYEGIKKEIVKILRSIRK